MKRRCKRADLVTKNSELKVRLTFVLKKSQHGVVCVVSLSLCEAVGLGDEHFEVCAKSPCRGEAKKFSFCVQKRGDFLSFEKLQKTSKDFTSSQDFTCLLHFVFTSFPLRGSGYHAQS